MRRIKWIGTGRRVWQKHVWEHPGAVVEIKSEDEAEALLTRLEGFEEEPSPLAPLSKKGEGKRRKATGG